MDWLYLPFRFTPRPPVVLVLGPAEKLAGTVTDESGSPISGAAVYAWVILPKKQIPMLGSARLPWLVSRTDERGRFEFGGIPADARVGLRVSSPGKIDYHSPSPAKPGQQWGHAAGQTDISITLRAKYISPLTITRTSLRGRPCGCQTWLAECSVRSRPIAHP
jgi:hypothetical protein